MRIAIIAENSPHGYSGGRYLSGMMAEALACSGHDTVYLTNARPAFFDDFIEHPTREALTIRVVKSFSGEMLQDKFDWVICIPGGRDLGFYESAVAAAESCGAQLALLNFETPNWFNALSPVPRDEKDWEGWRLVARRASLILSCAEEATKWARSFYTDRRPDTVLSHCRPSVNDAAAGALQRGERERRVVLFMRFVRGEHKGANAVADLIGESLRGYTLVILVGVGDVPNEARTTIMERANRFGVSVEFKRSVSDRTKFDELSRAQLLMFPSLFEGFGYPPVEAQYCGTPCVAYDLPVLREVSGNGITYVAPGDVSAFSDAVASVLQAAPDRNALRSNVAEFATLDAYGARLTALLSKIELPEPKESKPIPYPRPKFTTGIRKWTRDRVVSAFTRAALASGKVRRLLRDVMTVGDAAVWRQLTDEEGVDDIARMVSRLSDSELQSLLVRSPEVYRRVVESRPSSERVSELSTIDLKILRDALTANHDELLRELLSGDDFAWLAQVFEANEAVIAREAWRGRLFPVLLRALSEDSGALLRQLVRRDASLLDRLLCSEDGKYVARALELDDGSSLDAFLASNKFEELLAANTRGNGQILDALMRYDSGRLLIDALQRDESRLLRVAIDRTDGNLLRELLTLDNHRYLLDALSAHQQQLLHAAVEHNDGRLLRTTLTGEHLNRLIRLLDDNDAALLRAVLDADGGRRFQEALVESGYERVLGEYNDHIDLLRLLADSDDGEPLRNLLDEDDGVRLNAVLRDGLFHRVVTRQGLSRDLLRVIVEYDDATMLREWLDEDEGLHFRRLLEEDGFRRIKLQTATHEALFRILADFDDSKLLRALVDLNAGKRFRALLTEDQFRRVMAHEDLLSELMQTMADWKQGALLRSLIDSENARRFRALFAEDQFARVMAQADLRPELLRSLADSEDGALMRDLLDSEDGARFRAVLEKDAFRRVLAQADLRSELIRTLADSEEGALLRDLLDSEDGARFRAVLEEDAFRRVMNQADLRVRLLQRLAEADDGGWLRSFLDANGGDRLRPILEENEFRRIASYVERRGDLLRALSAEDDGASLREQILADDLMQLKRAYEESSDAQAWFAEHYLDATRAAVDSGDTHELERLSEGFGEELLGMLVANADDAQLSDALETVQDSRIEAYVRTARVAVIETILSNDDYAILRAALLADDRAAMRNLFDSPRFFLNVIQVLFNSEMLLARLDYSRRWNQLRAATTPDDVGVRERFDDRYASLRTRAETKTSLAEVVCDGDVLRLSSGQWRVPDTRCVYTLLQEIFVEQHYYFETTKSAPRIIDCGAHCGLSIAYFKALYPEARVTAFEPQAELCKLVRENVANNKLSDVEIVPKALAKTKQSRLLHARHSDSMAASFDKPANGIGGSVKVECDRLSAYLKKPIDFLKIDIEGAEYAVLKEAGEGLSNVAALACEFHIRSNESVDALQETLALLRTHGFTLRIAMSASYRERVENRPLTLVDEPESLMVWGRNRDYLRETE